MIRFLRSLLDRLPDAAEDQSKCDSGSCCRSAPLPQDDVVDWFDPALPQDAHTFKNRGFLRFDQSRFEEALAECNQGLALEQDNPHLLYLRGLIWSGLQEHAKAIDDFSNALRWNAHHLDSFRQRGYLRMMLGDHKSAAADFTRATRIDPTDACSFLNRGQCWLELDEPDKGLEDLEEALRLTGFDDFDPSAAADAVEAISDSDAVDPEEAHLRHVRATALLTRGQHRLNARDSHGALADFREAAHWEPDSFLHYNNMAWIMATCPDPALRDGKSAVELATKACEMSDWKEAWFTETLAAAYAEAGDFENAVKWQIATEKLYSEEDKAKCASVLPLYQSHQPFRDTGPEA